MANWKKFLFFVPRGTEGDNLVKEMARMLRLYADKSGLEKIVMKAAMVFPSLMLMKPSKKSKTKEERSCLRRRLDLWEKGEIRKLSDEADALQRRYSARAPPPKEEPIARRFGNLLWKEKVLMQRHFHISSGSAHVYQTANPCTKSILSITEKKIKIVVCYRMLRFRAQLQHCAGSGNTEVQHTWQRSEMLPPRALAVRQL